MIALGGIATTEGIAIRGVKRIFEREGLPSPQGKDRWGQFFIREAINDEAYRPHSRKEIENLVAKGQMSPEVATRLAVAFGTALPRGAKVVASREASAS